MTMTIGISVWTYRKKHRSEHIIITQMSNHSVHTGPKCRNLRQESQHTHTQLNTHHRQVEKRIAAHFIAFTYLFVQHDRDHTQSEHLQNTPVNYITN